MLCMQCAPQAPVPTVRCSPNTLLWLSPLRARNNDMEAAVALESKLAGYMTACLGWQGLGIAMRHFIRAGDTSGLAAALVEAAQHAGPNEEDLLLVRAVLCTAASSSSGGGGGATGQVAAARELLEAYASAAGHQPPATPLLRFTQLLLEALRERKGELIDLLMQRCAASCLPPCITALRARMLLESARRCWITFCASFLPFYSHRYAPSLDRDPMLVQLVEQAKWAALGGGRAGGGLLDIFSVLNGGAGVSSSPAAVGNSV